MLYFTCVSSYWNVNTLIYTVESSNIKRGVLQVSLYGFIFVMDITNEDCFLYQRLYLMRE